MKNIPLKICGITNVKSVEVAHKNKIKSLGFASKNLNGPNTVSDKKIQSFIEVYNYPDCYFKVINAGIYCSKCYCKRLNAKCLISLLHGLKFKINLIPYNPIPGSKYRPPSQKQTRKFQKYLLDHRIIAPLRISKGQDIQGACGQLVVKKTFEK